MSYDRRETVFHRSLQHLKFHWHRLCNEGVLVGVNRMHLEAMAALPPNVKRRVRALNNLQKEFVDIEAKFYSEVHALECKYEKLYKPLFEKV